jgi:DNA-directed RNA polymerase specialized sigma24 family protein
MENRGEGCDTRDYANLAKSGDQEAARKLWNHYSGRLLRLARARLRATRRGAADEEDVALSAFDSFCAAASKGRFPRVANRNDVWNILATIAARKAADLAMRERRRQPKSGQLYTEADLARTGRAKGADVLSLMPSPEPSPALAVEIDEEWNRLMEALHDEGLRLIALDRLAGYNDREIAARMGCTRRTIQRKLTIIRNAWRSEVTDERSIHDVSRTPESRAGPAARS